MSLVDDLRSLDPEFYKHLVSLKDYVGDVLDLGLSFAVRAASFDIRFELEQGF